MATELDKWEERLQEALEAVDHHLEETYGHLYPLRPNRPPHGSTARRQYDGLFSVLAAFSLGIGSKNGRGYVIEVRLSTFARISDDTRNEIEEAASRALAHELPKHFPGRTLHISRDRNVYKIHGDLAL